MRVVSKYKNMANTLKKILIAFLILVAAFLIVSFLPLFSKTVTESKFDCGFGECMTSHVDVVKKVNYWQFIK